MTNKKKEESATKKIFFSLNLFIVSHIPLHFLSNREESQTCDVVSYYFQQYFGSNLTPKRYRKLRESTKKKTMTSFSIPV